MVGFPTREINKCDVFYSPNFNIPFGIRIPIYSTIHDVVFLDVAGLTSKTGKLLRWFMLRRAVSISKKIFTVSDFSRRRIEYHFRHTPKIVVANCGINSELKSYKVVEKSPYSFPYLLFIGNLKKHKGLHVLLDAYEQATSKGFEHKLVLVGDSKNFKTADTKVLDRIDKLKDRVLFTGRISNEQMYNIISHASLLVQPSVYEGFGIPPLEALYLGCNALISDIPVFHEIYGKLPVTFFEPNNVADLSEKIVLCTPKEKQNLSLREIIDETYSFERSANLILSQLCVV
jgi:glycosyltransferase involved in cell wall biosynthesis